MKTFFTALSFMAFCFLSLQAVAGQTVTGASDNWQNHGNYTVHYSVFNSTFLLPDIAKANKLKRSKYESLINILVTKGEKQGGVPVEISGTVKNLLQQQKTLDFVTIKEQGTVYYLAPIRVSNKEIVHFSISTKPAGAQAPLVTQFTKTLYAQ